MVASIIRIRGGASPGSRRVQRQAQALHFSVLSRENSLLVTPSREDNAAGTPNPKLKEWVLQISLWRYRAYLVLVSSAYLGRRVRQPCRLNLLRNRQQRNIVPNKRMETLALFDLYVLPCLIRPMGPMSIVSATVAPTLRSPSLPLLPSSFTFASSTFR